MNFDDLRLKFACQPRTGAWIPNAWKVPSLESLSDVEESTVKENGNETQNMEAFTGAQSPNAWKVPYLESISDVEESTVNENGDETQNMEDFTGAQSSNAVKVPSLESLSAVEDETQNMEDFTSSVVRSILNFCHTEIYKKFDIF